MSREGVAAQCFGSGYLELRGGVGTRRALRLNHEAFFCQKRKNWDPRGLQEAIFLPKREFGGPGGHQVTGGLLLITNSTVVKVLFRVATVVLLN